MRACHRAAIALGSNLSSSFGSPSENLREAVRRLATLGEVFGVSTFHVTAPIGFLDQPDFVNAAAVLETRLEPQDLMQALLAIETSMGRDRSRHPPKGPRIIDLDLLLYDDLILAAPDLTLPHPAMHVRRFVLAPLSEICPDWPHPSSGKTVKDLLTNLEP